MDHWWVISSSQLSLSLSCTSICAYSIAAIGSWIEQGQAMTRRRGSFQWIISATLSRELDTKSVISWEIDIRLIISFGLGISITVVLVSSVGHSVCIYIKY